MIQSVCRVQCKVPRLSIHIITATENFQTKTYVLADYDLFMHKGSQQRKLARRERCF